MSEDQDKDFSKQRPKKPVVDNRSGGPPKRDYNDNKKGRNNKDYQVYYDQKGYEKGYDKPRDQSGQNKGNYSSGYDDYSNKPQRNDNYGNYRPKPHNPRQKRTGQDQGPNVWRKKTSKVSRDSILESFSRVEKHNEIVDWVSNYRELFVSERQQPVNEEVFQLDPNEGLIAKTNTRAPGGPSNYKDSEGQEQSKGEFETSSTNTTSTQATGNKEREMFDFGQERFDPIMDMRRRQKEGQGKEGSKAKKEDQWGDLLEEDGRVKGLPKNQFGDDDELGGHEEPLEHGDKDFGGLEGEEGGYSDIDAMFEKKLKNNEIQETFEDAFDDIIVTNGKKAQLAQMEDAERPEWEDVDTNKVIEDIKKEDFLANLPQNKLGTDFLGREISRPTKSKLPAFSAQTGGFLDELRSDSTKHSSDIDFAALTFGTESKFGQDDFGLNPEDLFPSFDSKPSGGFEGGNAGFLGHPMMQQGNMPRPMPNPQQLVNPAHQLHQFQQYQQMQQMQGMPGQQHGQGGFDPMNPMGQMGPRFGGNFPNQPQPYGGNQLPQFKRDLASQVMGASPGGLQGGPQGPQGGQGGQGFPRGGTINPSYPSFIFKYFSPNYEDKLWYYIDLQKRVQGPFSGKTMDEWYSNGHLPLTLNVTIGRNSGYKCIKDLADLIVSRTISGDESSGPDSQKKSGPNPQPQPGFSGINDLLKNRPDLAQYGQGSQGQRGKGPDEAEGGKFQQQPPFNQYQRYQNYQDRDREGDYGHRDYRNNQGQGQGQVRNFGGNDHHENQGGYQKRGGYQNEVNSDSPNRSADSQNKTTSPAGESKDKSKEQTSPSSGTNLGALGGLQSGSDIANQLKNMLGLGGGLGGLGGLAGLAGLGGLGGAGVAPTTSTTEQPVTTQKPVENKPENKPEKAQEGRLNENEQHNRQQEKHEKPAVKQEKIVEKSEKTPQSQGGQRKGSKAAPKIDTSDFPSLTETYK